MFRVSPVKIGLLCHLTLSILYSAPGISFRVMLVSVVFAAVGASGAVRELDFVMLPPTMIGRSGSV